MTKQALSLLSIVTLSFTALPSNFLFTVNSIALCSKAKARYEALSDCTEFVYIFFFYFA